MWGYLLVFCLTNSLNLLSTNNKLKRFFYISSKVNIENKTNKDIKYTTKYKKEYNLTPYQKQALIGIILGDGYLERIKSSYNTRLRIEQSFPEKEKYFYSLYYLFEYYIIL